MRSPVVLTVLALLLAACGGDEGLTAEEERALAAVVSSEALPEGWELEEAVPTEPGDPVPEIEGCEQLEALDASGAVALVTTSIDVPDAELPLLDIDLDMIVMAGPGAASAYVAAVADPATPGCLASVNAEVAGVSVVDAIAPTVVGGESTRLRFDFPPAEGEAAATLEIVAMSSADLLAVVEIAYATEVPPPRLDALLASIADRLSTAS